MRIERHGEPCRMSDGAGEVRRHHIGGDQKIGGRQGSREFVEASRRQVGVQYSRMRRQLLHRLARQERDPVDAVERRERCEIGCAQRLVRRRALPRGRAAPRLLSRAAAPCDTAPWVEDRRRLGVMVRRIALAAGGELRMIAPDDPSLADGWWEAEGDAAGPWRWTTDDAALPLPVMSAPALLRVICCPGAYLQALSGNPPSVRRAA
jgi:hypothetical protein